MKDNESAGETHSGSTSTSTSTTTTTTAKPVTTSTYQPTTQTSITTLPPKKQSVVSSTSTPNHYLSTTTKSFDSDLIDEDEYEYDDDYLTTDGKDLQSYQDSSKSVERLFSFWLGWKFRPGKSVQKDKLSNSNIVLIVSVYLFQILKRTTTKRAWPSTCSLPNNSSSIKIMERANCSLPWNQPYRSNSSNFKMVERLR